MMKYKRYGGNEDLYTFFEKDTPLKVIMEGDYKERHFVIGAHHTGHPDAYLEVKESDYIFEDSYSYDNYDGGLSKVHGGSTYFGRAYWDDNDKRTYVGWDYGHACDYHARYNPGGDKYDLIDILMDISRAECEIEQLNDEDPDYWNRVRKQG